MYNSYKVYYNNAYAVISNEGTQINENFDKVISDSNALTDFINNPAVFFNPAENNKILLLSQQPEKILQKLVDNLQLVEAAGGMVFNEAEELLMIFRRGKWDMPKGKLDKGEDIADCAVREVEEETGVAIKTQQKPPVVTWHAYLFKGVRSIKRTEWYVMQAKPGQKQLTPQTEEDIEEARWVKRTDLKNYKDTSYPLIWDLASAYAL